jgi:predicted O-methyltransferase YrrM
VKAPVSVRGGTILKRLPPNGRMVEIGVFVGTLSQYLLRSRPDVHLTMIDSWASQDAQPSTYLETQDRHALCSSEEVTLYRLAAKRRVHRYRDRVDIMAMPSVVAAPLIDDHSMDMVFIDGDHSYIGVCDDIHAWQSKVKPGGYLGGHDYDNQDSPFPGVKLAVLELLSHMVLELDQDGTWFCRC